MSCERVKSLDSKEKLDYGLVNEYDDLDLWYEPITDEIDGFVTRNKDGTIKDVYMKWEFYVKNRKEIYCMRLNNQYALMGFLINSIVNIKFEDKVVIIIFRSNSIVIEFVG